MPAKQEASTAEPKPTFEQGIRPTLVEGHHMRCPNCEQLRNPLNERELKRLDRNEKYAHELNVVYQCVKSTGGCGHIFSPGEQDIIIAYLRGDLVPAKHMNVTEDSNGDR